MIRAYIDLAFERFEEPCSVLRQQSSCGTGDCQTLLHNVCVGLVATLFKADARPASIRWLLGVLSELLIDLIRQSTAAQYVGFCHDPREPCKPGYD